MLHIDHLRRALLPVFIALPSVALLERVMQVLLPHADGVLSTLGSLLYLVCFSLIYPRMLTFLLQRKRVTVIFWCVLGIVFLAFMIIYPMHDSGTLGFYSDRDEALDIGASRLVSLENPYVCNAVPGVHSGCPESGTPIAPLPGGLVLAAPFFVMFGLSAFQNFFWLSALFCQSKISLRSGKHIAASLVTLIVLNPVILAEILSGGDYLANTIALLIGLLGTLTSRGLAKSLAWGCFLGIVFAWRAHFLLAAVPCFAFYVSRGCYSHVLRVGGAAAVTFLALVLPLFIFNSSEFSPFQAQTKLEAFSHFLPHPTFWASVSAVTFGLWAGWRAQTLSGLLVVIGLTINIPILAAVILNSLDVGAVTLRFYGWYLICGSLIVALGHSAATLEEPTNP
jgi:hypothetical protein